MKKLERNSMEKKEIKRKHKEVGHRKVQRSREENRKQRRLEINACFKKCGISLKKIKIYFCTSEKNGLITKKL